MNAAYDGAVTSFAAIAETFQIGFEGLVQCVDQQGNSIDLDRQVPNTLRSIRVFANVFSSLSHLMPALTSGDDWHLVPTNDIHAMSQAINKQLPTLVKTFSDLVTTQIETGGGIESINADEFVIVTKDGGPLDLKPHFSGFEQPLNGVLRAYHAMAMILEAKEYDAFTNLSDKAQRHLTTAAEIVGQIRRRRDSAKTDSEKAAEHAGRASAADQAADEAKRTASEAQDRATKAATSAASAEGKANEILGRVQNVDGQAGELQKKISGTDAAIDSFTQVLETRNQEYELSKKNTEQLISTLDENTNRISKLTEQGRGMLLLTTAAGLAAHYRETSNELDAPLKWAQGLVYFSLGLLALSVFAAFTGFWGFFEPQPFLPSSVTSFSGSIVHVLAALSNRLVWLLPALLLLGFSVRRHRTLFQLKHHYQHKYATAASVPGFKQEAGEHSSEIAAAVFDELLSNPVANLDGGTPPTKRGGPLRRYLAKIATDVFNNMSQPKR